MAVTPFIRPLQTRKGLLYNFQSALEDINLAIANTETKARFSKFVALRLPEIGTPDTLETDNKAQFLAQGETPMLEGLNANQNINLAQSFQNYALNFEALLLSRDDYDREQKLTVSEKVFWKWLKELGAIRYDLANNLQRNLDQLGDEQRWVEESDEGGTTTYKRVVQYVGDIDAVNNVRTPDNSYSEIYIHIPTNVGTTPYVLFDSKSDVNYTENMTVTHDPDDPLNIEYLSGRNFDDTHPFSLSIKAYFDLDDGSVTSQITDDPSDPGSLAPGRWFSQTINNSYYTDATFGVSNNQLIEKTSGASSVQYVRNTLDGITIDFDLQNYKLAAENPEIQVFSQFNDYVDNKDFEYNAILIYYDVFDPNNLDAEGNPIDIETNLYGILFLDKIEQSGLEFKIPCRTKYKPDILSQINGNAFAEKLNLKLDNSAENVAVEKSINDFNTFSMELYLEVLNEFRDLQIKYNDKLLELEQLRQDTEALKDLLVNTEDLNEIKIQLNTITTSLAANSAIFDNTESLVQMIDSVNDKVEDILSGQASVQISYNLDAIRAGNGILVDRSTPNRLIINATNQEYNIGNNSIVNLETTSVIPLERYTNYVRHENGTVEIVRTTDYELIIDDTVNKWQKGQSFKLVIADGFNLDVFDFKIVTDSANISNNGVFGKVIALFNDDDFSPSDDKPIYEIVCINSETLEFRVDKIR